MSAPDFEAAAQETTEALAHLRAARRSLTGFEPNSNEHAAWIRLGRALSLIAPVAGRGVCALLPSRAAEPVE